MKCSYCKKEISGLMEEFYCPPNYNLLAFCPRTKERNCSKERQDLYFKLEETAKLSSQALDRFLSEEYNVNFEYNLKNQNKDKDPAKLEKIIETYGKVAQK